MSMKMKYQAYYARGSTSMRWTTNPYECYLIHIVFVNVPSMTTCIKRVFFIVECGRLSNATLTLSEATENAVAPARHCRTGSTKSVEVDSRRRGARVRRSNHNLTSTLFPALPSHNVRPTRDIGRWYHDWSACQGGTEMLWKVSLISLLRARCLRSTMNAHSS